MITSVGLSSWYACWYMRIPCTVRCEGGVLDLQNRSPRAWREMMRAPSGCSPHEVWDTPLLTGQTEPK